VSLSTVVMVSSQEEMAAPSKMNRTRLELVFLVLKGLGHAIFR